MPGLHGQGMLDLSYTNSGDLVLYSFNEALARQAELRLDPISSFATYGNQIWILYLIIVSFNTRPEDQTRTQAGRPASGLRPTARLQCLPTPKSTRGRPKPIDEAIARINVVDQAPA